MEPIDLVEGLAEFVGRGAGTDAERRAAGWLAGRLSPGDRDVAVETFWCRPNWALAHALHAALAVLGGLVSLVSGVAGATILAVALVSVLVDSLTGVSLGRRLTPERASQNVLVAPLQQRPRETPVRLILTANYDAGRTGLVYRDALRRPTAITRRALQGFTPGWLGWLSIAIAWLLAIAILRLTSHTSHTIGAAQLPPTVALLVALALLLDVAVSRWSPSAGDNATGLAVAAAATRALEATPPRHLEVELVATGAGDGDQIGLRRYLADRKRERTSANTVVLGIAACGAGRPSWWHSDGALIPLRYGRRLRQLAEKLAADEPHLHARPHRGRGATPALPARIEGIPAITLGCLDENGLAPRSHQTSDTAERLDPEAFDAALHFALLVVDAIDAAVGELHQNRAPTPA
jgi:hypothetical protein